MGEREERRKSLFSFSTQTKIIIIRDGHRIQKSTTEEDAVATVLQDDHRTTFVDVDYDYNRDADDADVHHHRQNMTTNLFGVGVDAFSTIRIPPPKPLVPLQPLQLHQRRAWLLFSSSSSSHDEEVSKGTIATTSSSTSSPNAAGSEAARRRVQSQKHDLNEFILQHTNVTIAYLTDVEGDKHYLDRYVERSKVLTFKNLTTAAASSNTTSTILLPSFYQQYIDFTTTNSILVFGGDICDKGGYDLYCIRQLLDLKRRYRNRVYFILGNRDINKLRILQELGTTTLDSTNTSSLSSMPYYPGTMWLYKSGKIGDPSNKTLLKPLQDDPSFRLKWILSETMGSSNAFELRKHELQWEQQQIEQQQGEEREISDIDVVRSYQKSCHPTHGELGQFLLHGQLAFRLGPMLFVHGGLPITQEILQETAKQPGSSIWDDLSYFMPWMMVNASSSGTTNSVSSKITTIDDWIDSLNEFCYTKLDEWKQDFDQCSIEDSKKLKKCKIWSYRGGYNYGPSYSGLIQYCMSVIAAAAHGNDGSVSIISNPTVVYSCFTPFGMPLDDFHHDDNNNSVETGYARATKEFFQRSNLQIILVGHKPQGDMPTPIRLNVHNNHNHHDDDDKNDDDTRWILCCDTSYSSETIWYDPNLQEEKKDDGDDKVGTPITKTNLGTGKISKSFRGDVAVTEVLLTVSAATATTTSSSNGDLFDANKFDDDSNIEISLHAVEYHGVLSDGTEYETRNLLDCDREQFGIGQVAPDRLVSESISSIDGKSTHPHQSGKWWIKHRFSHEDDGDDEDESSTSYLLHAGEGFNDWNWIVQGQQKQKDI